MEKPVATSRSRPALRIGRLSARLPLCFVLWVALFARCLSAQEHEHGASGTENLGRVNFQTSCSATVQPQFNRAVALLHSFQFRRATDAFNVILRDDPSCGVSYWGIALSAWGNPMAVGRKEMTQLEQGQEAVARGRSVGTGTAREGAYIEAVAKLYTDYKEIDQRTRMLAYEQSMSQLSATYPDDKEAAIFYALALAASADPADKTYAKQLKAGAILEKLFKQQPNHPGLAHYIIHAYDFPPLAPKAENAAKRYSKIAPSAPHALHMPSHTFTRVGYWQESIDANLAAAAAAKREGQTAEELHASDYMVYAYLQTGQDLAAKHALESLPEIFSQFDPNAIISGAAGPAAAYFALAAIPARYALERRAWGEAVKLQPRASSFPYADAITYFGLGLGAAHLRELVTARAAVESLQQLRDQLSKTKESYWAEQVEIQRQEVSAWLALAEGRKEQALAAMRAAAASEDGTEKNAVTPGPIAPARELLGEMLLEMKHPAAALREFEAMLTKEPKRFRALYGAAQSAKLAGNDATARKHFRELLHVCERADKPGRPELAEAYRTASATIASR